MAGQSGNLKKLIYIFVTLLVLTLITVAVSKINFGSIIVNVIVAMIIATVKVSLVGMYFMHLKWEKKLLISWSLLSIPFIAIMIGFMIWDTDAKRTYGKYDELKPVVKIKSETKKNGDNKK